MTDPLPGHLIHADLLLPHLEHHLLEKSIVRAPSSSIQHAVVQRGAQRAVAVSTCFLQKTQHLSDHLVLLVGPPGLLSDSLDEDGAGELVWPEASCPHLAEERPRSRTLLATHGSVHQ